MYMTYRGSKLSVQEGFHFFESCHFSGTNFTTVLVQTNYISLVGPISLLVAERTSLSLHFQRLDIAYQFGNMYQYHITELTSGTILGDFKSWRG